MQYPKNSFPGQENALEDNTHFNDFGAHEIALCVIQEIKKLELDLKSHLKSLPPYSPNKPHHIAQWTLPMSPRFEATKPDGN